MRGRQRVVQDGIAAGEQVVLVAHFHKACTETEALLTGAGIGVRTFSSSSTDISHRRPVHGTPVGGMHPDVAVMRVVA
jgi:hypothetical protein